MTPEDAVKGSAHRDRAISILFADDSTLFFALRMREHLKNTSEAPRVEMTWVCDQNALSYRQMSEHLPEGPDRVVRNDEFETLVSSDEVLAILTSRVFRQLGDVLQRPDIKHKENRACVVGFLGGLDFFQKDGYTRRRNCDGVFVIPRSAISAFEKHMQDFDIGWQEVGFGHPTFMAPTPTSSRNTLTNIYFFAQAISPSTRNARMHMLKSCAALARAHPDRTVWIKLRHLPHENRNHLHLERYDYASLLNDLPNPPSNLQLTSCSMDEALNDAAIGITCTSTAAIDLVRAGVPCMVHLDYVDNFLDPLVEPMRHLFRNSGLITGLEDMLNLRWQRPEPAWVDNMFCSRDLGTHVLQIIARFQKRPFQIRTADDRQHIHADDRDH